jgi:peptide/nickel transport system substrate-binding protein
MKKMKKKLSTFFGLIMIASMLLSACTTPAPVTERIVETIVVTQLVEREGKTVVETQIVEVLVTPTPKPPTNEPGVAAVHPEFKNPDTYMVVTGSGEPESLDPAWTYETSGATVENNIYEGLVFFNRERTDDYIPALATDWTLSDDGKTYVFNIRTGVKFHAGGTLEPHDVAYTAHRAMLQGRVDGPAWMQYEAFFGSDLSMASINAFAEAYTGKESFDEVTPEERIAICEAIQAAVVANDEAGTVTYHLNAPVPWFLMLASQNFMGGILDREWMIENGDWDNDCATWDKWADPAAEETILFNHANGTGPYLLDHWTPGVEMVLTAFPDYWRTEPMWEGGPSGVATIQNVVIKNISEWGTRLSMFEAGDADYIYVANPYRPQLEAYHVQNCDDSGNCTSANPEGYIQAYVDLPQPAITPAQFNWNINMEGGNAYVGSGQLDGNGIPFDFFSDEHIRKAFNYCFDFEAMVHDALADDGVQAQGPLPMGMIGYIEGEDPLWHYDLAKCEEEFKLADLDHDGTPAGEDEDDIWNLGFYMQIGYNEGNDARRILAEILKAGIESVNPNFNIQVLAPPWPVLLNARRSGKLPIYIGGWSEDYHDPHNWVLPFLHPQGTYGRVVNMPTEISNQFVELIVQGATKTAVEERSPIYERIQRIAQEKAVNIWAYQPYDRQHLQQWIHGFYYNPAYGTSSYAWIYAFSKEAP